MRRKENLVVGEIYHVFSKSIAGFRIFNNDIEFLRMKYMLRYYQLANVPIKFSRFMEAWEIKNNGFSNCFNSIGQRKEKLIQIIAYCLMPTHIHLILKQLKENGTSIFIGNVLNSYTRYFNIKHKRKGPLWEGRFKNIFIETDEHLLHLTRYIHLNPTTACLIDKPEKWPASSYREYLLKIDGNDKICEYDDILYIEPVSYKKFVEDRISYQQELAKIRALIIDAETECPPRGWDAG